MGRQRASQMPEIFGQLGVGKRKSQNKQIVWQNKNYFRNARTLDVRDVLQRTAAYQPGNLLHRTNKSKTSPRPKPLP